MRLNEYQEKAHAFSGHGKTDSEGITYCTFGLMRSLGELANEVKNLKKKKRRATSTRTLAKIAHETSHILWYVAEITTLLDMKLDAVARRNLDNI